jgi:hypothetical protein
LKRRSTRLRHQSTSSGRYDVVLTGLAAVRGRARLHNAELAPRLPGLVPENRGGDGILERTGIESRLVADHTQDAVSMAADLIMWRAMPRIAGGKINAITHAHVWVLDHQEALDRKLKITLTSEVVDWIIEITCKDRSYGARPLRRAIQRYVEDPLSEELIRGHLTGGEIDVYLDAGSLAYRPRLAPLEAGRKLA